MVPTQQAVLGVTGIEIRFLDHVRRRKLWLRFHGYVNPSMLSVQSTKIVWQAIDRLHQSRKRKTCSFPAIRSWIETHYLEKMPKVSIVLDRMKKANRSFREDDHAVLEFVQRRAIEDALKSGIDILERADGLDRVTTVRDTIDFAIQLGRRRKGFYSYFQQAEKRQGRLRSGQVSCGFSKRLDDALGGGLCPGELGIFIGPTGRGKSQVLCNLTAQAIQQGRNVLYCTLQDLTDAFMARRIDQILLGWPERRITKRPRTFRRKMRSIRRRCGQLYIRDFTDQTVSFLDIKAAVEEIERRGVQLGLLVIDYLDTMGAHTKNLDQQVVFREINAGLRNLGAEHGFPVWTACQGNRESLDADMVRLSQIAGAISKTQGADVILGMSQTEEMKDDGYMILNFLKTRMGSTLEKITLLTDPDTMRVAGKEAV